MHRPMTSPATSSRDADWTIAHDYFFQLGGAERVTATLATRAYPNARVVARSGDDRVLYELGITSRTEFDGVGYRASNYRQRSLLSPLELMARRPVDGHLLSSSYAFAHHRRATGKHVVYCHSPLRQIWSGEDLYASSSRRFRLGMRPLLTGLRRLDVAAAKRADAYIATNKVVAGRIRQSYNIEPAAVIPPPVSDVFFRERPETKDFFVWAGRIVEPYKRLSLVIEAFRENGAQLIVAGEGRDRARLEANAPANVRFVGHLDAAALSRMFAESRGLIFPSEDDFGMVPLEAMASGTPVLAWAGGGALESVVPGTGLFFHEATAGALSRALRQFQRESWDHAFISDHSASYGAGGFSSRIVDFTNSLL